MTQPTYDIYDIAYLIAENAYRAAIDRKFRIEREIDQKQEELRTLEIDLKRFEKIVAHLKEKTQVRY